MPRIYKKKIDRDFNPEAMKQAVIDVLENKMSIRKSAQKNQVTKSRLCNYVKKAQNVGINNLIFSPDFSKAQVFSNEMEAALETYLLRCSAMFYGLTPKLVRRLAYEYATKNSLTVSERWLQSNTATEDWFWGFMRRHPRLSVRKPEATSLARMTSFNKATVKVFQDKLEQVISRYSFTPEQIFNLDETGVTTVQRVQKIVGKKGAHQIGQVTSRERGELVTHVGMVCANGSALPPVWIFPRQRFDQARMMKGITETGPMGLVHSSGWMTCENFLKVLGHFVKHVRCSQEKKVLLIMDNHESHLSIDAVDFCRANGVVILTLPPHTSNKLQPLDRTIFGPFKTFFNQAADSWMLAHPGETLSIYDLPLLCLQSWDRAANPVNIKSGFRCSGIVPFDRNIFSEEEFLSSAVTDRPLPQLEDRTISKNATTAGNSNDHPSTSSMPNDEDATTPKSKIEKKIFITPDIIKPFPKAAARKENSKRGRKRGRCMIATDTPEKQLLEEKRKQKEDKTLLAEKKREQAKRKCFKEESSEDEAVEITYNDHSSDDSLCFESDEDRSTTDVPKGGYIIVNVHGKASTRKYVAIVDDRYLDGYEVRFLKRNIPSNRFSLMEEPPATVPFQDVLLVLPNPINDTRPRFKDMVYFNTDLTEYSLS